MFVSVYLLLIGDRNKISDLVHSELAYQQQAKKLTATAAGPIRRFPVHMDQNQQLKQD